MNTEDIINCLKQIKDKYIWSTAADIALVFAIKCVERFGEEMEAELNDETKADDIQQIKADIRDIKEVLRFIHTFGIFKQDKPQEVIDRFNELYEKWQGELNDE